MLVHKKGQNFSQDNNQPHLAQSRLQKMNELAYRVYLI